MAKAYVKKNLATLKGRLSPTKKKPKDKKKVRKD